MNPVASLELKRHMVTPASWLLLAAVQATLGWMFLDQLGHYERIAPHLAGLPSAPGVTAMVGTSVLSAAALAMVAMTPLLAARGVADERSSGVVALVESSPLPSGTIVRGRFYASLAVLLCVPAGALLLPASLAAGTQVDFGLLGAAALVLAVLGAMLAALATLCSVLSTQPLVSAALAFGALLGSWALGSAANIDGLEVLAWLSPITHLRNALGGVFDSRDIAWFAVLCVAQLAFANQVLRSQRGAL